MVQAYSQRTAAAAPKGAPVASAAVNMNDIMVLTARLAQVLAEEADMLSQMNIKKVGALQKEKLLLIAALERQKKMLQHNPAATQSMSQQDKDDLRAVIDIFQSILGENYRRLLVARDVNQTVVNAITEVVKETTANHVYDKKGTPDGIARESLSVTLNEQA